jgi:5-formyltetrahydrofolate cyclo-ligase
MIAAFSATRNEVDLSHLYAELLEKGVSLCFPRVVGAGEMVFAAVESLDELAPGAFGIAEPTGPGLDVGVVDAFLVPGLAFDRRGARLGFGGGYYDRALGPLRNRAENVPLLIGIGYSWQVLETPLPLDEWDVPLSHVVTEEGAWRAVPKTET